MPLKAKNVQIFLPCFAFFVRFAVLVDESPQRTQMARRFWGALSHFAAAPGSVNGGGCIILDCSALGFEVCSLNVVERVRGCRESRRTAQGHRVWGGAAFVRGWMLEGTISEP